MADLSLDQYIQKNSSSFKNRQRGRIGVKSRLKPVGQRKDSTQFTVTGVGNVKQRLGFKSRQQDARQKILQKTKTPLDARAKIDQKKAQAKSQDVRSKINSIKAKKVDARQLLQQKKKQKPSPIMAPQASFSPIVGPHSSPAGPRFMVTGLGKVSSAGMTNVPPTITRTIGASNPLSTQSLSASAVAGSIVKTINNEQLTFTPEMTKALRITKTVKAVRPKPAPIPVYIEEDEEEEDMEYYEQPVRPAPIRHAPLKLARPVKPPLVPKAKPLPVYVEEEDEVPPTADIIAPAAGFKIVISNLHEVVSQDDIVELFGAIGDVKKARLVKPGTAEVIYRVKNDAITAVKKYHQRELDGLPMSVVLTATVKPKAKPPPPPAEEAAEKSQGPLKLGKSNPDSKIGSSVDSTLLHKALFKTAIRDEPSRPVTFTVKI